METLGIYIQIPFCSSKCSFCNFSSQVARAGVFEEYCRAFEIEIESVASVCAEAAGCLTQVLTLPVDTLYFGGGTPTIVGFERLARICSRLESRFRLAGTPEFTIEVTPGSADEVFLRRLRDIGVNRLSIGAQSFDDQELRCVGRLHSAADTRKVARTARRAGFTNVSLDLIAGLPYQTGDSWLQSLTEAVRLEPEHISIYLFEIDEKSRLGREKIHDGPRYHARAIPGEDFMADAYETARAFLASEGYAQYEISNFAHPGYESRHNLRYWQLEPYLGLGAGAHSFDGERRWANVSATHVYQQKLLEHKSPVAELKLLSPDEQVEEFFFLGLRQRAGVDLGWAARRWGRAQVGRWEGAISDLTRQGWIEQTGDRIRLAEQSQLVSNEIFEHFLV